MNDDWGAVVRYAALFGVDLDSLEHVAWRARQDGMSAEVVLEGYRRAFEFWAERVDTDDLALEDLTGLPAGSLDLRCLDAGIVWVDVLRRPHRISDRADVTDDYLANVIGWLQHFAVSLAAGWARMHEVSAPADESVWLEGTVLMRALRAEAEMRGIGDQMPRPDGNGVGDR